jgi:hypothetical protein
MRKIELNSPTTPKGLGEGTQMSVVATTGLGPTKSLASILLKNSNFNL